MSQIREIRSLTGLRGLAALYVVQFHFIQTAGYKTPWSTFQSHGYLAVDLFFVLSGFVMTLNYAHLFEGGSLLKSLRIFLSRRIARIYPLYLLTTVAVALLMSHGMLKDRAASHFGASLIFNLLMIQTAGLALSLNVPAWSISAEWFAYLLFPLILSGSRWPKGRVISTALALGCITGLCLLPLSFTHGHSSALLDLGLPDWGLTIWRCVSEFTLGVVAAQLDLKGFASRIFEHSFAANACSLTMLGLLCTPRADFFIAALCPILILTLLSPRSLVARLLGGRLLRGAGVLSYSIYLIHGPIGEQSRPIRQVLAHHGIGHTWTLALLTELLLILLLSWAAHQFVEVPGRRITRRLLEGEARAWRPAADAPLPPGG